jgi:hypothetical protein
MSVFETICRNEELALRILLAVLRIFYGCPGFEKNCNTLINSMPE